MSTIIDAVIEVLKRCVYNCVSYVIMLTVTESCVSNTQWFRFFRKICCFMDHESSNKNIDPCPLTN